MTVASRAVAKLSLRNRALGRLLSSLLVGVLAGVLLPRNHGWFFNLMAAWDAALLALLVQAWVFILRYGPEQTRRRAAAADPGRNVVWAVVVAGSTMSLFAGNSAVRNARTLAPTASAFLVVLALLAVGLAWMLVHTAYTLRYAHLYYREAEAVGGLKFPNDAPPADIDFAYYAFTVGMCFGATDVLVTETRFRRATLGHALLSFLFNTGILALTLNLIFTSLG